MTRMVGLEAKRKLERYCESFDNHMCSGRHLKVPEKNAEKY